MAPWPGGQEGHGPPIVETCRKIANVVGKLSRLLEIVKVVDGGGGGEVVKI